MEILKEIAIFFSAYPFTISFFGAFFAGEEMILTLSYFAGQGVLPFWKVFIAAYMGTIISDAAWFLLAKTNLANKILNLKYFSHAYKQIVKILNKSTQRNLFFSLLLLKFAYGSRIITITYLSRERMNFKKYNSYNFIISFIWLVAIVSIGWLAGKGAEKLINHLKDFQIGLMILIIFIVLVYFAKYQLKKYLSRRLK